MWVYDVVWSSSPLLAYDVEMEFYKKFFLIELIKEIMMIIGFNLRAYRRKRREVDCRFWTFSQQSLHELKRNRFYLILLSRM